MKKRKISFIVNLRIFLRNLLTVRTFCYLKKQKKKAEIFLRFQAYIYILKPTYKSKDSG